MATSRAAHPMFRDERHQGHTRSFFSKFCRVNAKSHTEITHSMKSIWEPPTQRKIPLIIQSDAPRSVAELIAGVPEQALLERPLRDKWSVVEIIAQVPLESGEEMNRRTAEIEGCCRSTEWVIVDPTRS